MKTRISTIIFLVTMVALLAAVACGSSSTAVPTGTPIKGPPPPTETPGSGDPRRKNLRLLRSRRR